MTRGILGRKVGMTQVYNEEGRRVPVTVIQAGPCVVVQQKTKERDGYQAVQLGFETQKAHRVTRPRLGHLAKAGLADHPSRVLGEVAVSGDDLPDVGAEVTVAIFEKGEKVDITGTSKGKGFQGVVKRHGFSGGPKTHGSQTWRRPGSIGMAADPARVLKGTKMPGQTGGDTITTQNLEITDIRAEENLLLIHGAVPGPNGGLVRIAKAVKSATA